jgi:hypothetical protein
VVLSVGLAVVLACFAPRGGLGVAGVLLSRSVRVPAGGTLERRADREQRGGRDEQRDEGVTQR